MSNEEDLYRVYLQARLHKMSGAGIKDLLRTRSDSVSSLCAAVLGFEADELKNKETLVEEVCVLLDRKRLDENIVRTEVGPCRMEQENGD